ncbi:inorganic phosphate transporter [Halobacterium rubrum]|uniref:inorganic phosphate transporter n=1 Tax=Halobacterium TaxID=2239 RepID=UPI001F01F7EC|nr:inorganic phosphate transporter [Halobacterium rubrum]MDH5020876.1 inorganic phosphate transporter [Halobacterium rubrum]
MPSLILLVGAFLISFTVAAVTGASSVSVSMAPAVGSNSITVLRGAFVVGAVGFVGAVAQGAAVTRGVGTEIVSGPVTFGMGTVALVVIGVFVGLGIYFEHSIPVAFSTFGAVAGVGFAADYSANLDYWALTLGAWVASGVVAVVLAYGVTVALKRFVPESPRVERWVDSAVLFAGVVFSFIGGGSQVGLAVGPLVGTVDDLGFSLLSLMAFGGLGITLGAWVKSPVMLQAVGRQYASLGQRTSLAVLVTAIPMVQVIANVLGVPISYNHIIINSIAGCGFAASGGGAGVDTRKYAGTLASWVATLFGSTLTAYVLYTGAKAV